MAVTVGVKKTQNYHRRSPCYTEKLVTREMILYDHTTCREAHKQVFCFGFGLGGSVLFVVLFFHL